MNGCGGHGSVGGTVHINVMPLDHAIGQALSATIRKAGWSNIAISLTDQDLSAKPGEAR